LILQTLMLNTTLFIGLSAILGLLIGSFLNVVIYRLPIMLEKAWRQECAPLNPQHTAMTAPFNLLVPRSHCPHCEEKIPFWRNIPLLSYILLLGKCSACKKPISIRYFLVELFTTLITTFIAYWFGVSFETVFTWILTWNLIALIVIDWKTHLLPDNITLPLIWLGLLANCFTLFAPLSNAVFGAIVAYLSLWLLMQTYKLFTKKVAMGHGDFKLFAVFGAWIGWQTLPLLILLAALSGAVLGIIMLWFKKQKFSQPIPFGPFLAVIGWILFMFHNELSSWSLWL
jgi:leader peptidase (prepilin peptidase) / N-methyltransferase